MALQTKLEQLNIPEREAQVYIALLQLGLTAVGPIVTKTKLHRMLVYQSLEKLKDMRMATMVMKKSKQHWQATNPSIILERIKKQEKLAEQVVDELEEFRQKSQDDVHVQIIYGVKGLIENLEEAIKSAAANDKTIRIIGGADADIFYGLVGDWYENYLELLQESGVKKKLIAPKIDDKIFSERFGEEPGNEYRFMEKGISSPTFTRITKEMVSIEVYGKEPVVIQIKNKTIAQAYTESFELLWKQAGEE